MCLMIYDQSAVLARVFLTPVQLKHMVQFNVGAKLLCLMIYDQSAALALDLVLIPVL